MTDLTKEEEQGKTRQPKKKDETTSRQDKKTTIQDKTR